MKANNIQIGGSHYKYNYQPWDFIIDTKMPYVLGCAIKYIVRWLEKGGVQDLKKCIHYLNKAGECDIRMPYHNKEFIDFFCNQLRHKDAIVIRAICNNNFLDAIMSIEEMIILYEFDNILNNTSSSKNYFRG